MPSAVVDFEQRAPPPSACRALVVVPPLRVMTPEAFIASLAARKGHPSVGLFYPLLSFPALPPLLGGNVKVLAAPYLEPLAPPPLINDPAAYLAAAVAKARWRPPTPLLLMGPTPPVDVNTPIEPTIVPAAPTARIEVELSLPTDDTPTIVALATSTTSDDGELSPPPPQPVQHPVQPQLNSTSSFSSTSSSDDTRSLEQLPPLQPQQQRRPHQQEPQQQRRVQQRQTPQQQRQVQRKMPQQQKAGAQDKASGNNKKPQRAPAAPSTPLSEADLQWQWAVAQYVKPVSWADEMAAYLQDCGEQLTTAAPKSPPRYALRGQRKSSRFAPGPGGW